MTLTDAQAAFRRSPGRATALAYMDAAITTWERAVDQGLVYSTEAVFRKVLHEIREWLMNERTP